MPFLLLLLVALTVGSLVTVLAAHYPHTAGVSQPSDRPRRGDRSRDRRAQPPAPAPARPARPRRPRPASRSRSRSSSSSSPDSSSASLAYLIRSNSELAAIDRSVGQWGVDHRYDWSTDALAGLHLARRHAPHRSARDRPSRSSSTSAGRAAGSSRSSPSSSSARCCSTNGIKDVLDRVRPEFNPIAETLGPSFPSGHSAGAAAFWAAAALLVSRGRTPHQRAVIFGVAAGIAAGVACSRVMLGVHWLSDVVAGVLFGWAWFCRVQHRVRRPPAPLRRARREGRRGRGGGHARAPRVP